MSALLIWVLEQVLKLSFQYLELVCIRVCCQLLWEAPTSAIEITL